MIWFLLGCPASKGAQWDLLQYLSRVLSRENMTKKKCVVLVLLEGENNFKPRPQNRILVSLMGSFKGAQSRYSELF